MRHAYLQRVVTAVAAFVAQEALAQCAEVTETQGVTAFMPSVDNFFGTSLAIDTTSTGVRRAAVGAIETFNESKGAVHFFQRSSGMEASWQPDPGRRLADDPESGARLGTSVDVTGNFAIAGAPFKDDAGIAAPDAGAAYIFTRFGGDWPQEDKLTADPDQELEGQADDRFGTSVAMSPTGNLLHVIIGAPQDDAQGSNAGAAYIFQRTGMPPNVDWVQKAKLTAVGADPDAGDLFGSSVSINGDVAVVGAPATDSDGKGAVYVFQRSGDSWPLIAGPLRLDQLDPPEAQDDDRFGAAVSLSGPVLLIGAPDHFDGEPCEVATGGNYSGAAYVIRNVAGSWNEEPAKLLASDCSTGDRFGISLDVDGDELVVGTAGGDAAYYFRFDSLSEQWVERARLLPAGGAAEDDEFGGAVAVTMGVPVVADRLFNASDHGKSYFFSFETEDTPDCNKNGILDDCELLAGSSPDCNENGIIDACDIDTGESLDCDADGVPDDCFCGEIVFVFDNSISMIDPPDPDIPLGCEHLIEFLEGELPIGVRVTAAWALTDDPVAPPCLTSTVELELGSAVPDAPGEPEPCVSDLVFEMWADATAIVANANDVTNDPDDFKWSVPPGRRVIVPIGDEPPCATDNNDGCDDPGNDLAAINNAIAYAQANGVFVFPVTGSQPPPIPPDLDQEECPRVLARMLATETGGTAFHVSGPLAMTYPEIGEQLLEAIMEALAPCGCPWDIDDDGGVGFADLTYVLIHWGDCLDPPGPGCVGDFNYDGGIGFADLTGILLHWGACCPGGGEQAVAGGSGGEQAAGAPNSGEQADEPAGAPLPYGLAAAWLMAGGEQGLLDGSITPAQVAECMSQPTPEMCFAALINLLGQD